MIRRKRVGVVMAVAVATAGIFAGVMMNACAETAVTPTTAPAATQKKAGSGSQPAFAAMDYYDQSCAKCHGPQGSFYGPSLGRDLDDKGLIKEVRDMADGPGQSHIEENEVLTETAFHRALMMGTPYLSVTGMKGNKWSGEVMTDSKVTVTVGGKEIEATVTDWSWTAEVPEGTKVAEVVVTAEREGKKTVLKPAEGMYSHVEAIPPIAERKKK